MYSLKYNAKSPFPYADGYYAIFPKVLESRDVGDGSIVVEDDYIIYFKPETPVDIKERFTKDYAEYYAKIRKDQLNGTYRLN